MRAEWAEGACKKGGMMAEKIRRAARWLKCLVVAVALGAVAAWMGWNAWESLRQVSTTPLAQLTLGQIITGLFWLAGAVIAGTIATAVWEDRDEDRNNW